MAADDKNKLEAFLVTPQAYGVADNAPVTRIETHISVVFLVGERAYKLKKPVDFGYLDFTSLEKRREACVHELELNRRTAPDIYLKTVPIRRTEAGFVLGQNDGDPGGPGEIVEWLLEMVRFDQADVLSAKAATGTLARETVEELARVVSDFHGRADIRTDAGGQGRFVQILKSNRENYAPFVGTLYEQGLIDRLNALATAILEKTGPLLDARRQAGWVRHCHGDLHLGNVALIKGVPVPFDCIEFNDDFARIDVLYDLAFLLMDLSFREREAQPVRGFANAALNAYLQTAPLEDIKPLLEGLSAVPLFMSTRAGVRSHVNARMWQGAGVDIDKTEVARLANAYIRFALDLLTPLDPLTPPASRTPCLYAIGGLSGTGKTTMAKGLAPLLPGPVGAIHLRTDVLRKKRAGVGQTDRLPPAAYTQAASDAVYEEMMHLAGIALAAGQSVICDAVFAKPAERAEIEAVACKIDAPFSGLWLNAPSNILEARVDRRTHTARDASDATSDVVRQQLAYDLGAMTWGQVESEGTQSAVLARCMSVLGLAHL